MFIRIKFQQAALWLAFMLILPQVAMSSSDWVLDTISDSYHYDSFHQKPVAIDAENNYHVLIARPDPDMMGHEVEAWYTTRPAGQEWTAPTEILEEEFPVREQSIVVTSDGEIVVATAKPSTNTIHVLVNDEEQWVHEDIPFPHVNDPDDEDPEVASRYKYAIAADESGGLHLVWAVDAYVGEDSGEGTISKLVYASNATGEWEAQILENLVPLFSQNIKMDIAPDGSAHILYFNQETQKVHYLNNQNNDAKQAWEDLQLESGESGELSGEIIYEDGKVHVFLEYWEDFFAPREIHYYEIQDATVSEPVMVNVVPSAHFLSAAIDAEGEIRVAYLEHVQGNQFGALFMASSDAEEGFTNEQLLDEDMHVEKAHITCDKEDEFLIFVSMGEFVPDLFMLHEDNAYFETTFTVEDPTGTAIDDAVITFDGEQAEPGSYVFSGLETGTYAYLVEKDGFLPQEGEVTISDSDKTIDVILQYDETSVSGTDKATLNIFPNPASDLVTVRAHDKMEKIQVFAMNGSIKESMNLDAFHVAIETSDWIDGLYLIRVYTSTGVFYEKVLVQH